MKSRILLLKWTSAALLAASMSLTGCASGAKPDAMVLTVVPATTHNQASLGVEVTGGSKTNPLWKSDISSEDFSSALVTALKQSTLFSSVTPGSGDYHLKVQLVKVLTPSFGFTLTSTVVSEWQLVRTRDARMVSDEFISTDFSATTSDAFAAVKRLRLANEGAARANITEGIRRLSAVNLNQ